MKVVSCLPFTPCSISITVHIDVIECKTVLPKLDRKDRKDVFNPML